MNIQEQPTAMTLVDNKIVSMKPIRIAYGTSTELAALDTFAKSLFSAGSRFVCTDVNSEYYWDEATEGFIVRPNPTP